MNEEPTIQFSDTREELRDLLKRITLSKYCNRLNDVRKSDVLKVCADLAVTEIDLIFESIDVIPGDFVEKMKQAYFEIRKEVFEGSGITMKWADDVWNYISQYENKQHHAGKSFYSIRRSQIEVIRRLREWSEKKCFED